MGSVEVRIRALSDASTLATWSARFSTRLGGRSWPVLNTSLTRQHIHTRSRRAAADELPVVCANLAPRGRRKDRVFLHFTE